MNHYKWLEQNLQSFFKELNIDCCNGIIVAHGDKCYGYKNKWEKAGIPFYHGIAIYLLSYIHPFSNESRDVNGTWVPVDQWVIDNYNRFKPHLAP